MAAAGPMGKRRPQHAQAVSAVCVSMVCVSMMVCVTPSRNLASPETVQYCLAIQGRVLGVPAVVAPGGGAFSRTSTAPVECRV